MLVILRCLAKGSVNSANGPVFCGCLAKGSVISANGPVLWGCLANGSVIKRLFWILVVLSVDIVGLQTCRCEAQLLESEKKAPPRTFLMKAELLAFTKQQVQNGDSTLQTAVHSLRNEADKALNAGLFSVTFKKLIPPSGDKHDYMSLGPYWWPDPKKPDGLPYVRRDGETNPEVNQLDRRQLSQMTSAVETLALAYYFTDHQPYGEKASELLRVWFIDKETRMNPHLRFGQSIPGRVEGRGIGIIDTVSLTRIVDAIGLLQGATAWTLEDQQAIEIWFGEYLDWMLNHEYGRNESKEKNNHGTWYDVQIGSFSMFLGREELAREVIANAAEKRLAAQLTVDGKQPFELARTKAFDYSVMNLRGWLDLAELGDQLGINIGNFVTDDGKCIRLALDWLIPYAVGDAKWEYQQLGQFNQEPFTIIVRRAAIRYREDRYFQTLTRLAKSDDSSRVRLLWPLVK